MPPQQKKEAERLGAAAVDDDDERGEVGGENSKRINNKNKNWKKSSQRGRRMSRYLTRWRNVGSFWT